QPAGGRLIGFLGTPEEHLVQTMADKQWQIHRADAWIDSIYAVGQIKHGDKINVDHPQIHAALTEGVITMAHVKQLDLIGRYASRLQRDYRAALKDLQSLQAQRKQQEQEQMQRAAEVKKFCEMKKEPFIPAAFGFVSQAPEIDDYITSTGYIEQAAIAHRVNYDIEKYLAQVGTASPCGI